jgi:O-succinylbenzoate synthase
VDLVSPPVREHRLRIGDRLVTLLEGPAGWGEYSPLAGYPCDPARAWRAAHEAAVVGWPAPRRDLVAVNALVDRSGFDPAALAEYPAVKVKVGFAGDLDLVAAVRDAVGPRVALRVDANGAWDLDTAVLRLARLARYDLELAEQPVATLDELARLRRRTSVPIAADECVRRPDDARRLRALDAVDALVLKVQPCGGVRAALELAALAAVPAIPTSMHETSVGVAAGLALAAALPELPYACGLATVASLPADVTTHPLVATGGVLRRRAVTPDPQLIARYSTGPAVAAQEASR